MSTYVADHLPAALLSRLSPARALDVADRAIVLCTVDEHGWPHPAMFSSLELIARDARNIRLATHVASRTTKNLKANGRALLIVADETVHYVKGDARLLRASMDTAPDAAAFNIRVDGVLEDNPAAYEDARLTSGLRVTRGRIDAARARALVAELAGLEG